MKTLAQCHRLQGNLDSAARLWTEGLQLARDIRSRDQEAGFLLGMVRLSIAQDQVDQARKSLSQVESLLRGSSSRDRAEALLQGARLDYNQGLYRQALARAEEGGAVAQELDDMELSAVSLRVCADCLEMVGMDRDAGRLVMEAEGIQRAQAGQISLVTVETPTARRCAHALRQAWDHHEAGRSEYGSSLLEDPIQECGDHSRGLAVQLAIAAAQILGDSESRSRAKTLLGPILEGLTPELRASLIAREDVAPILEA